MSFRGHYGIPVHKQEFQVLSHEVFFFLNPFLREQKESSSAALASPSLSFPLRQERRVFAAATRGLHSCCCRGRKGFLQAVLPATPFPLPPAASVGASAIDKSLSLIETRR